MSEPKKLDESTHELLILRDDRIIETTARLQRRISERFPESGLCDLCGHLLSIARQAAERSQQIDEKIVWIRVLGYTLATAMVLIMLTLVVALVLPSHKNADIPTDGMHIAEFLQTMEAGTNEAILLGAGIYFLISLETRIKRGRALAAVHELRAMCHIIDMHQLTKDPERVLAIWKGTSNSPRQQMTPLELNRYLDYCSEMLSLTGKIAALYVKRFDDAASVAAVSEVEQLSTAMSRKIWQKIMILNQSIPNVLPVAQRQVPDADA